MFRAKVNCRACLGIHGLRVSAVYDICMGKYFLTEATEHSLACLESKYDSCLGIAWTTGCVKIYMATKSRKLFTAW